MNAIAEVFEGIQERLDTGPAALKGVTAVFQFDLAGDEPATYHIVIEDGVGRVVGGPAPSPGITISMDASDFMAMIAGRLNATTAFMTGKLKVKGDLGLALKLQALLG